MTVAQITARKDTSGNWATANPILAAGEPGFDTTLKRLKIGDGVSSWSALGWATMATDEVAAVLAAAESIGSGITVTDGSMKAVLDDPESAFATGLNATIDGRGGRLDIRSVLLDGETLDQDGVTDMSAIITRALQAANAYYVANGTPVLVSFPNGIYKVATRLAALSGAGIIGTDPHRTIFRPQGQEPFLWKRDDSTWDSEAPGAYLDDVHLYNFTIDGSEQFPHPTTGYYGTGKGLLIQHLRGLQIDKVFINDTMMTGFGLDFFSGTGNPNVLGHIEARGCGRAQGDRQNGGAGSGIGIGTGWEEFEPFTLAYAVTYDNNTNGIFGECLPSEGAPLYSKGAVIGTLVTYGNHTGMRDCGWDGLQVANLVSYDNIWGFRLDSTSGNVAGVNGRIRGVAYRNGHSEDAPSSGITGAGIYLGNCPNGKYTFDMDATENYGPGVVAPSGSVVGPDITLNGRFSNNNLSGIILNCDGITRMKIRGTCNDNGIQAGLTYRDGITVMCSTTHLDINVTAMDTRATKLQNRGVDFRGSGKVATYPRVQNSTLYPNLNEALRYQHSVSGPDFQDLNNIKGAPPTPPITITDTFTRADSTTAIGTADTGQAYTVVGTWGISGNQAYLDTIASGAAHAVINSGMADCTVSVTFAAFGSTSAQSTRLIFRSDGTVSNYWQVRHNVPTNTYQVFRTLAGATVQVGTDLPATPAAGDTVSVILSGSSIIVKVNGVTQATLTSTSNQSLTYHGIGTQVGNSVSRFDNLSITG